MATISISEKTHRLLLKIKFDKRLKNMDKVIRHVLQKIT